MIFFSRKQVVLARIVIFTLFVLLVIAYFFNSSKKKPHINPYDEVVLVTNTIAWPYNKVTFGNDTFKRGSHASQNIDTLILDSIPKEGLPFPKDFQFGVANAAYQYEGNRIAPSASNANGTGWSMWDVFSKEGSWLNPKGTNISKHLPTSLYTKPSGEQAVQGFDPKYYSQDFKLAKELGVKVFRLSISWPRLFPRKGMKEPDPAAIQYYVDELKTLKAQGFDVFITLYHWDLPAWLYNYGDPNVPVADRANGWFDVHDAKDNLTIKEFQKYADACFKYFGSYTSYFSTFNEPLTFTNVGITGTHAPGKEGFQLLRKLNPAIYGKNETETFQRLPYLQASNIIKAHFVAYKTFEKYREQIKRANQGKEPMLGIVLNSDWAEPYRITRQANGKLAYHADDIRASKRNMDFMLGWWLDPVMFGHWPQRMQYFVKDRLPKFENDTSCMNINGELSDCDTTHTEKLANYIQQGGALDNISLNHYTGYFAIDLAYAQRHSVPSDQYGTTPTQLTPGWQEDQHAFLTQFRYQLYGDNGDFANEDQTRIYIIGDAGVQPWLRHTFFSYTKLLQYIDYFYLAQKGHTKQNKLFSDLNIYLTENGTSIQNESQKTVSEKLKDTKRITFIKGNLAAVAHATSSGIPVKLYTYWSLTDNFEWAEGYDSRFGLIWIDYDQNFKRELKDSYYYFQKVINNNKVLP